MAMNFNDYSRESSYQRAVEEEMRRRMGYPPNSIYNGLGMASQITQVSGAIGLQAQPDPEPKKEREPKTNKLLLLTTE